MDPAIFSSAARRTRAAHQSAASQRDPTIRQLRRKLRHVRLNIKQRYCALHEYARIYHALAAREAEGSERKLILLYLAEEADVRLERVEMSLRKFRISNISLRKRGSVASSAGLYCVGGLAGLSHYSIV